MLHCIHNIFKIFNILINNSEKILNCLHLDLRFIQLCLILFFMHPFECSLAGVWGGMRQYEKAFIFHSQYKNHKISRIDRTKRFKTSCAIIKLVLSKYISIQISYLLKQRVEIILENNDRCASRPFSRKNFK